MGFELAHQRFRFSHREFLDRFTSPRNLQDLGHIFVAHMVLLQDGPLFSQQKCICLLRAFRDLSHLLDGPLKAKVGLPSREHHDMGPTKREVRKIIDSKVPWEVICDRSQEGIASCGLFGERLSFLIVLKRPFLIDKREKILSEIVWMSDNLQLLVQLIFGQFRIQKRN